MTAIHSRCMVVTPSNPVPGINLSPRRKVPGSGSFDENGQGRPESLETRSHRSSHRNGVEKSPAAQASDAPPRALLAAALALVALCVTAVWPSSSPTPFGVNSGGGISSPLASAEARHTGVGHSSKAYRAYIIRQVFGPYGAQAVRVAQCESGLNPRVLGPRDEYGNPRPGLFQLGTYERRRSGWYTRSSGAWVQARSAFRWFVLTGRSWRAWSCKP